MAAFSANNYVALIENIRTLYRRMRRASMKKLTGDDFLNLFVPAEYRAAFKAVGPLIEFPTYGAASTFNWSDGSVLVFHVQASTKLPFPRQLVLQPDAPPELVNSITRWLQQGGNASREFGRVEAVLRLLNEKCSQQELRYFWPSILPLLTVNERNGKLCELAKQLTDVKVPKNPPVLASEIRFVLRKASETVALVGLLQDGSEDETVQAEVLCHAAEGHAYREPGIGAYAGIG